MKEIPIVKPDFSLAYDRKYHSYTAFTQSDYSDCMGEIIEWCDGNDSVRYYEYFFHKDSALSEMPTDSKESYALAWCSMFNYRMEIDLSLPGLKRYVLMESKKHDDVSFMIWRMSDADPIHFGLCRVERVQKIYLMCPDDMDVSEVYDLNNEDLWEEPFSTEFSVD